MPLLAFWRVEICGSAGRREWKSSKSSFLMPIGLSMLECGCGWVALLFFSNFSTATVQLSSGEKPIQTAIIFASTFRCWRTSRPSTFTSHGLHLKPFKKPPNVWLVRIIQSQWSTMLSRAVTTWRGWNKSTSSSQSIAKVRHSTINVFSQFSTTLAF